MVPSVTSSTLPSSISSNYFSAILRAHRYNRLRSTKDDNGGKEDYRYNYLNSNPVNKRPYSSRSKLVKLVHISNYSLLSTSSPLPPLATTTSAPSSSSSRDTSSDSKISKSPSDGSRVLLKVDENISLDDPKTFKASTIVKRGKFKGYFDDRCSRCVFHYQKHNHMTHCYCSNIPIIESPLKKQFNNPLYFNKDTNEEIMSGSEDSNEFYEANNYESNSIKLREAHIIARVCYKFVTGSNDGGLCDFLVSPSHSRRSIRKIQSLSNMRKSAIHYKIQEEDEKASTISVV